MCRSVLTDDQISTLIEDIKARQPKACPCCGVSEITPTFWLPDQWECWNQTCLATWRTGE